MAAPSDVQQQVFDLLARSSSLSFVTAEPEEGVRQPALTLNPGQRVTAEVIGQAMGNRVPVQIGNQQVNLELPMQVRAGQSLDLTFLSSDPRPTFALYRSGVGTQQVSLTDASRLLSLLISNEQFMDPKQRSSLESISDLLRRTGGEKSALAGFLDEFLTYSTTGRTVVPATARLPDLAARIDQHPAQQHGQQTPLPGGTAAPAQFEDIASKLLLSLAQRARFTLVETINQPLHPLPLLPGDQATGLVKGTLPDGRTQVQVAGENLEMRLPHQVSAGEILRFTLVSQLPRPIFALMGQPVQGQSGEVSEAARWLSTMLTNENKDNEMQRAVVSRLQQVITSLPPGSPALAAIMDEAMTYGALPWLSSRSLQTNATVADKEDVIMRLLQALMQGSRLALVEPKLPAVQAKGLQFAPGEQVRAEVLQNLGNGRFAIRLGDTTLDVALPKGVQAGDRLNLFFVSNDPPTFLLVRNGRGQDATVSNTGRWISNLLGMQNRNAPTEAGLGVLRTLLQKSPDNPAQLEQALNRGVRESGLFYESHLSRWFSGKYPLESLLREPQARLSPMPQTQLQQEPVRQAQAEEQADKQGKASAQQATSNNQNLAPKVLPQTTNPLLLHKSQLPQEMLKEQLEIAAKGRQPLETGADQRLLPLVKEQLNTLQSGQLLFQGELFPGQEMELRVREHAREELSDEGGDGKREEGSWETDLSLTLPKLGVVSVTILLKEGQIMATVDAAEQASLSALEQGLPELREQLDAAGLPAGRLSVKHEPQD